MGQARKITKEQWDARDWKRESNAEIGRSLGVSRQAAGRHRKQHNRPEYERPKSVTEPGKRDELRVVAGKRVRAFRESLGLSQAQLGERVQAQLGAGRWPRSAVHSIEAGSPRYGRRLTIDSLLAFSESLGVTPADLIRPADQGGWTTPAKGRLSPTKLDDDATFREIIGDNVERWREYHSFSPGDLAYNMRDSDDGSWTATAISRMERGEHGAGVHGIHVDSLVSIAHHLGVTPADLVRMPGQGRMSESPKPRLD